MGPLTSLLVRPLADDALLPFLFVGWPSSTANSAGVALSPLIKLRLAVSLVSGATGGHREGTFVDSATQAKLLGWAAGLNAQALCQEEARSRPPTKRPGCGSCVSMLHGRTHQKQPGSSDGSLMPLTQVYDPPASEARLWSCPPSLGRGYIYLAGRNGGEGERGLGLGTK